MHTHTHTHIHIPTRKHRHTHTQYTIHTKHTHTHTQSYDIVLSSPSLTVNLMNLTTHLAAPFIFPASNGIRLSRVTIDTVPYLRMTWKPNCSFVGVYAPCWREFLPLIACIRTLGSPLSCAQVRIVTYCDDMYAYVTIRFMLMLP